MRILTVDDNRMIRRLVRRGVESRSTFSICGEAGDGCEALNLLEAAQPDVIVTDIEMPILGGIRLTSEVKARLPKVHVLALSSAADPVISRAMRDAGASGYLLKNGRIDRLVYALEVSEKLGPDRRTGQRSRMIADIWDAPLEPSRP